VITNKRSLESTVLIQDGQIIVLGGLIQDSVTVSEDKVPFLGDIPWLGAFFRHEIRTSSKTNLMIFIRPYVLRSAAASNGLTEDRYDYLRGEQVNSQVLPRAMLPTLPAPKLPKPAVSAKPAVVVPASAPAAAQP
jgi:general secretion pathway protein D